MPVAPRLVLSVLVVAGVLTAAAPAEARIAWLCPGERGICAAADDGSGAGVLIGDPDPAGPNTFRSPSLSAAGDRIGYVYASSPFVDTVPTGGAPLAGTRTGVAQLLDLSDGGQHVAWVERELSPFGGFAFVAYHQPFGFPGQKQVVTNPAAGVGNWDEGFEFTSLQSNATDFRSEICRITTATSGNCYTISATQPGRNLGAHDASPDRSQIVATSCDAPASTPCRIALHDAATGAPLRDLTAGPTDGNPSFSPDGAFVAYDDGANVRVVPVASGPSRVVGAGTDPTWGGGAGVPAAAPGTPTPSPVPTPGTPVPGAPPPGAEVRSPAKITVERARVRGSRLDVVFNITSRATGQVAVEFRSGGRTTRFRVSLSSTRTAGPRARTAARRVRISRPLSRTLRRKRTGILTLRYGGNDRVRPEEVRLRAASAKAGLKRTRARIRAGRLEVAGTISRRARGVVLIRMEYENGQGAIGTETLRATIRDGRWSASRALPSAAASRGGQLAIQFTGYEKRRIRGEQLAKLVTP